MPKPARGALLWEDNFNGGVIDESRWGYEPTASMAPPLNDEMQRYLGRNNRTSRVADGALVINALRSGSSIVSARLSTFGRFSFTYGVVEARMKVPYVQGFWPAFWMLGANVREAGWPACGEVDIMEVFGTRRGRQTCSTVHNPQHSWGTKNPLDGGCAPLEAPHPGWHVWKMVWTPQQISFYIDENETPIWSYARPADGDGTDDADFPYTKPEYFIVNLAVGGNGPSEPVDMSALDREEGVQLLVDYVRVYALPSDMEVQTSIFTNDAHGTGGDGLEMLELPLAPSAASPLVGLQTTSSSGALADGAGNQGMLALLVCGFLMLISVIVGQRFKRRRQVVVVEPLTESLLSVSEQGRGTPLGEQGHV